LRGARRSVTAMDLDKFEQFRRKFDPSFANSSGGSGSGQGTTIKWPSSSNNQPSKKQNDDDDDLYR
jgi:transitional endoplasmic reticulum ATPase